MDADAQITFLPCSDLEASRRFYTVILGLEVVVDQGTCLIFGVANSSYVGVCEHEDFGSTEGVIVTFVTDDVDGWCGRILEAGGKIDRGPEHSSRYDIYHAFVHDPDGNILEIQRFDDPKWFSKP